MSERIQTDAIEQIESLILNEDNDPITGLTDILITIRSVATGYFLDFDDMTLKNSAWTTRQETMTELDSTNAPGVYYYSYDTSTVTNITANDTHQIYVDQDPGIDSKSTPQNGELKIGQYADYIDKSIAGVETKVDMAIVDIAGVETKVDTAIVDIAAIPDGVWDELSTEHVDANSMGFVMKLVKAMVQSDMEQINNQWIIYDPDSGLPWLTFSTLDRNGNPTNVSVYKRELI